jgi:4-hydroxythreonine-4-phosphate dehydrogenase
MKEHKPIIGITMGDVNGIGPELLIKVLTDQRILGSLLPVVYGSGKALFYYRNHFKIEKLPFHQISTISQLNYKKVNFIDCTPDFDKVEMGRPSPKAGAAAFRFLEQAVQDLQDQKINALVTLPIDKATIQSPDFKFPGHTEYLAQRFDVADNLMLMVLDTLRVAVVTGHIPIQDVARSLNTEKIINKLKILNHSLKMDFSLEKPKIAVLGLNPHAGDNGLIGSEDQNIIVPAVEAARKSNILAMGPYPADGFFAMGHYQKFDAVLAMYHDQGLIPFKTLAQGQGVNFTAGMPVVRTSPDHGTAYDIVGKNIADDISFREALYLALDVWRRRTENEALHANSLKTLKLNKKLPEVATPVEETEELVAEENSFPD